jgi:predicted RNA-binding Zn ribbon-like protein
LAEEADLGRWIGSQQGRLGAHDAVPRLEDALRLRGSLIRVFSDAVEERVPEADALAILNDAAGGRGPEALVWTSEGPRQVRLGETVLGRIAASAMRLLTDADPGLLRRCANPRCVLFFAAANPRRVYCSAACSLRTRVARNAARQSRGSP